jgi:hypothetical protein
LQANNSHSTQSTAEAERGRMAVRETRGSSASSGQQQQQPQQQQRTLPPRAGHPRRNALRKPVRMAERLDLSTLKTDFDPTDEVPKAQRPMGLQEAPTFWPSEKQWADPLAYIQSIADEGRKYGIIKVCIAGVILCLEDLEHTQYISFSNTNIVF